MSVKYWRAMHSDRASVEQLLAANALPVVGVAEALTDFTVAEGEGRIVGVAGLEMCGNDYALLRSAAVDARWRGLGVGGALVDQVIADARGRGLRALYLLTTTAEAYFPLFGFVKTDRGDVPDEIRRSAEFSDACPASATVMALRLDSGPSRAGEAGSMPADDR